MDSTATRLFSRMSGCWDAQPSTLPSSAVELPPSIRTFAGGVGNKSVIQGSAAAFEAKAILGGNFLQLNFQWESDGEQHESLGIIGFDSISDECFEFWANSNGTAHSLSTRTFDVNENGIRLAFESPHLDTGKVESSQSIYTIQDDGILSHRIVLIDLGGTEKVIKDTKFFRKQ